MARHAEQLKIGHQTCSTTIRRLDVVKVEVVDAPQFLPTHRAPAILAIEEKIEHQPAQERLLENDARFDLGFNPSLNLFGSKILRFAKPMVAMRVTCHLEVSAYQ